jgi:hypothetical protein
MDGNGTLFGTLSGNTREILHKFTVDLPKKHGRGGQSALRFARLRMEKRHNYVRKVGTADCVVLKDVTLRPRSVVVKDVTLRRRSCFVCLPRALLWSIISTMCGRRVLQSLCGFHAFHIKKAGVALRAC